MKHHFIDYYWELDSPIHRMDPRMKILLSVLILLAIVITPNGRFFDHLLFLPLLILLYYISNIPILSLVKRLALTLPLVMLIGISLPFVSPGNPLITFHFHWPITITDTGVANFTSVVIKALSAIIVMTLLTATTRFRDLIAGMQKLRFPTLFTSILGFMYRYLFLFIDEIEHLNIGRQSRSFGKRPKIAMKGFGWMISSLFLRSFERAERIYHAMCARGFNGTYKTMTELKVKSNDILICLISVVVILTIKFIGHYYG